jgi:hypothetical protein
MIASQSQGSIEFLGRDFAGNHFTKDKNHERGETLTGGW